LPPPAPNLADTEILSERHIFQLWDLYRAEWWSADRSLQETHAIVAGSAINFGIIDCGEDQLVAYSRIITDYIRKALIFDVIVAPTHRGFGLGEHQMNRILNHPALTRVAHFELCCKPDLVPFYRRWNFTNDLGDLNLMRLTRSK
jgi:predicted GNAT family N-acyltransferase